MLKLEQAIDKQVTVKLSVLSKAVNCKLISLDDAGIWVASGELTTLIRDSTSQVVLPSGYPKVFVPYARLDWLVLSTENLSDST
jgi:hypothetical protein